MTVAPPTPAPSEVDVRTGWQHPVPDSPPPLGWADWIHTPPGCGETDPETARASREVRLQIRLAFPSVWRVHLEALPHYDSAYAYDERYDYEDDWTSDPNYRRAVQHFRTYDREGFVVPQVRHNNFIAWLVRTLQAAFGLRVLREPDLHVSSRTSEDAAFLTASGKPKLKVQPDAVVLPQALNTDREHSKREHNIRLDQGDALPELVVEVLSYSTEDNDLGEKWRLYAALGIREYLLIDVGEPQEPGPGLPNACGCTVWMPRVFISWWRMSGPSASAAPRSGCSRPKAPRCPTCSGWTVPADNGGIFGTTSNKKVKSKSWCRPWTCACPTWTMRNGNALWLHGSQSAYRTTCFNGS